MCKLQSLISNSTKIKQNYIFEDVVYTVAREETTRRECMLRNPCQAPVPDSQPCSFCLVLFFHLDSDLCWWCFFWLTEWTGMWSITDFVQSYSDHVLCVRRPQLFLGEDSSGALGRKNCFSHHLSTWWWWGPRFVFEHLKRDRLLFSHPSNNQANQANPAQLPRSDKTSTFIAVWQ